MQEHSKKLDLGDALAHELGLLLQDEYSEAYWNEALDPPNEGDAFISVRIKEFNELQKKRRTKAGKAGISKGGLENKIRHMKLVDSIIGDEYASKIDEKSIKAVCDAIDEKGGSERTLVDYQNTFMEFVSWLHENKHIEVLPRNHRSKALKYTPEDKEPDPPIKRDVIYLLDALREHNKEKLELYCLLHLNCGAYMGDIGQFKNEQFDEKNRTLTYSRKKTGKHKIKGATYILWDRTFELVKKFRNKRGKKSDLLFLNKNGNCITLSDKGTRKDVVGKAFREFVEEHASGYKFTMMDLRKSGATFLYNLQFEGCVKTFN